ncbi:hypothetical protein WA577_003920, partial [Blastocystis sp. JDR]
TVLPDTKCAVFWDISSNLNATAQFLVDSLVADGRLALAKTENAMVYNRGEAILPTERLLSLLKSKETSLSVGKSNIYANLRLIIQHNKSRRILEIHGDLSIKEFKQKCLALHNLQALKTTLLFNGVAMRDEDLLSSYGVDNATFIYMVTEEEAQCM